MSVDCHARVIYPAGPPRGVRRRSHPRARSHPWDNRPANGLDTRRVSSPSPDVARVRFAAWVKRTLDAAYARGLTVKDIEARTGVGSSTWDRWRNGQGGQPKIDRVQAFAEGLGVDPQPAFAALGAVAAARSATEPELDPDVRAVARFLADPNVSAAEKDAIRLILRRLAPPASRERRQRDVS